MRGLGLTVIFCLGLLCVQRSYGDGFSGLSLEEQIAIITNVVMGVGGAVYGVVSGVKKIAQWGYNLLFPHVDTIENTLLDIQGQIKDIKALAARFDQNVQASTGRVLVVLQELPKTQETLDTLAMVRKFLVHEQAVQEEVCKQQCADTETRVVQSITEFEKPVETKIVRCIEVAQRVRIQSTLEGILAMECAVHARADSLKNAQK
jgi:hypothetical protein